MTHSEKDDRQALPPLDRFTEAVRAWFLSEFKAPTAVQAQAWEAVQNGENVLACAPTGSGKTLAAFLAAIDRLVADPPVPTEPGVRILYVSPMKALAADVQKNLRLPLEGIAATAASLGLDVAEPTVAMRTGDTPAAERRRIANRPPQILITTPESLYLMLTSQASSALARVETVIVDEVHSVAGSKRGAHLALSLERLDALLERPAQRVGLSATVRPAERVARFLTGGRPVRVVGAGNTPDLDLSVRVPVPDMARVAALSPAASERGSAVPPKEAWKTDRTMAAAMAVKKNGASKAPKPLPRESRTGSRSVWPHLEAKILDLVEAHRSTIVFVNNRGLCERLTVRLNELYAKRHGLMAGPVPGGEGAFHSAMGSADNHAEGLPEGFEPIARAHHGSVSKERRAEVEAQLKSGDLRCVVATSSLELGIDMGAVDLVVQVAPPLSVAGGLQRVGRANHSVGGRSRAVMFPRTRVELVDCAVAAEAMVAGAIEETRLVENPLDVLAQQTVAAVARRPWEANEWFHLVRRAENFRDLPRDAFDAVLSMLAGDHAVEGVGAFSPKISWDRETGVLSALPASLNLAVSGAGTIPDRGLYPVFVDGEPTGRERRRVGELDEEMVHESRVGDVITLGTSTWRIKRIQDDRVLVEKTGARASRLPFWHGEGTGRPFEDGLAKGELLRAVEEGSHGPVPDDGLARRLGAAGLDGDAQANLCALAAQQRAAAGALPTDRRVVMEYVDDEAGDLRLVVHSPFGKAVNAPWALAVADRVRRTLGYDPEAMAADDGIVLRLQPTEDLPGSELLVFDGETLAQTVRGAVAHTALFSARFRECAARALLMRPVGFGKRAPLWLQRVQGGQLLEAARRVDGFPILLEAMRECLADVYDLPALEKVQGWLRAGTCTVTVAHAAAPSPFAANLLFGYVVEHLYDGDRPHAERAADLLSIDPALLAELVGTDDVASLIDPGVLVRTVAELQWLADGRKAKTADQVAAMLRTLGPLTAGQVAERCADPQGSAAWLEGLLARHLAFVTTLGGEERWAAATDAAPLHQALGCPVPPWAATGEGSAKHPLDALVRRFCACHGPVSATEVARGVGCGPALATEALGRIAGEGELVEAPFGEDDEGNGRSWVSAKVLRRLRARSRELAVGAAAPVPAPVFVASLLEKQQVPAASLFDRRKVPAAGTADGDPLDLLAETIALYEGVFLPVEAWEDVVFPTRVPGYRPAMLDELLESGDVVWQGKAVGTEKGDPGRDGTEGRRSGTGRVSDDRGGAQRTRDRRLAAFWPTDSPFAPVPVAPEDGFPATDGDPKIFDEPVRDRVWHTLAQQGPAPFAVVATDCREEAGSSAAVAAALEQMLWDGLCLTDSFDAARGSSARVGTPKAPRRRSRSRYRGRAARRVLATFSEEAVTGTAAATSGRWSLVAEGDVADTERVVAAAESLIDRYGVVAPACAQASGIPGGFAQVYPVLKAMEEAGSLWRGSFVEGLGPLQFAPGDLVEALRQARDGASSPSGSSQESEPTGHMGAATLRVLPGSDPGQPLGTLLAWPETAERPRRTADSWCVFADGDPVLWAAPRLKAVALFGSGPDREALWSKAVGAVLRAMEDRVRRQGGSWAREHIEVETVDGGPSRQSPLAPALEGLGFVPTPDGLRFYPSPY